MDHYKLCIRGGIPLVGETYVSGGKNTTVALIPAVLLSDDVCVLENLPDIEDVRVLVEIMQMIGCQVDYRPEEKVAVIDLLGCSQGTAGPTITTAPTRVGLFYQLREGETLGGMIDGDSKVGDGEAWTPEIKVKGGNSAFYSIGVGKGK